MPEKNSISFKRVLLIFLLIFGVFWKQCDSQVMTEEANKPPDDTRAKEGRGGDGSAFFAQRSCHQLLKGDSGDFYSPDYMCSNPPLWCNWTIQVAPAWRIDLYLEDLTPDDACHLKDDQVHVDEPTGHFGGTNVLQKCWKEAKYTSSSNTLYVVLLIGGWPTPPYRGFYGRYQAFGPPVVYNPQEGLPETNMGSQSLPSGLLELNERPDPNPDLMYDFNNQPSEMTAEKKENEEGADTEVVENQRPSLESYSQLKATPTVESSTQEEEGQNQNQEEEGPNQEKEGPNQEEEGPNQEQEGPNQEQEGPNQEQEGPNQEQEGPNQEQEGPNQEQEGPNQEKEGPNQEQESQNQEKEGPNQEKESQNQEQESQNQEQESPNQEQEGPNQEQEGPNQEQEGPNQEEEGQNLQLKPTEVISTAAVEEASTHPEEATAAEKEKSADDKSRKEVTEASDQLPVPSEEPEPELEPEETHPHPNMVEPLSDQRAHPRIRNHSGISHLPGDYLFEVAVEMNFSPDVEESWDNLALSLLFSVEALISKELENLHTPLSMSSERTKRLSAGALFIVWLQLDQGPGGLQVHRTLHSALQGLISTHVGVGGNGRKAVILSVSTADVDECLSQLMRCDLNADCENRFGSYSCRCRSGFHDESLLGSAGTVCVNQNAAGCSSSSESRGVYVLFFLLSSVLLLLLGAAGLLYLRHHRGAFLLRGHADPNNNNNNTNNTATHHYHADSELPPPPPPARGFRDVPLLRFSSLQPGGQGGKM
ncbi:uncharacterized protein isoform X2 [Notothenia coriiceps]|uniref:Uncharacterized protein isoform X2 n=1 Tax=Notothenia coriiceps TaxID=8208 RepID=A0A6I9PGP8_9TELE|nr:PREDICTED: uncharacterized protein LOC104960896 isoform X2 [Notothenia coriiceps]